MRKLFPAVLVAVVLSVAGCSDDPAPTDEPSAEPTTATSAAVEPTPTDSPSAGSSGSATPQVPIAQCLKGRYQLSRFVSVGEKSTYGTGSGGDVAVTFDDGSYTMSGGGKDPIELTLAGQRADLSVDGTVEGTVTTEGYQADFTVGKTTGSATLGGGSAKETLTMDQVAAVLAPEGPAALACGRDQLIMVFDDIRLELERP